MQDVQTTNLNLARRETDAWCSQNRSISSRSALEFTVAAGTNEVAMWALQLYIGFFPNFHSPFREPTATIFRTVFSHGISVPPPTSWLSLGHFLPRAPGAPFFSTSWPGTHAHCHICQIQAHTFDTLQILFTLGIWLLCVQVLAHRSSTSSLQVYIQHWHVVYPTELHLHFQSHPLILAFRILIPGSAVPKPPFCICGTATR
jgi:hypothetical protein